MHFSSSFWQSYRQEGLPRRLRYAYDFCDAGTPAYHDYRRLDTRVDDATMTHASSSLPVSTLITRALRTTGPRRERDDAITHRRDTGHATPDFGTFQHRSLYRRKMQIHI